MKKLWGNTKIWLLTAISLAGTEAVAQANLASRLTYSVRLNFQVYGLPFQNLGGGFRNIGGAVGIDYALNKSGTTQQTLSFGYQSNRQHETSFYLNTQFCYRPLVFGALEPSVAIGVGRMLSYSNARNPYYEVKDGSWEKSSSQRQGHWQAPISLSLGYRTGLGHGRTLTPFVAYDVVPIINYNSAFVALPYSLLSVGTRYRFQSSNSNRSSKD